MIKLKTCLILLMFISLWGCSNGNDKVVILEANGKHPANWVVVGTGGKHPPNYISSPLSCNECHGKDLLGGISKVSCFSTSRSGFSCHPQGPAGHPANYADPGNHGASAKAAATGVNGMAHCKNCHGSDYRGAGTSKKDCIGCHRLTTPSTNAPHAHVPWRGGTFTHTNVDQSNAPACAQCHANGANSTRQPLPPAPAGTAPGCFNNTLCHGIEGHSSDPRQPWNNAENHGAAAKGDPTAGDGMALCKSCHGQALAGNGSAVSCFSCHTTAPHSPVPWRRTITNTTGRIHTDTNTQNAPVCAGCHINNQRLTTPVAVSGTPGCFDNSMCHGATGHNDTTQFPVPAQPWNVPVNHGAKAKGSTTVGASGFTYCRNCHGDGSPQDPLFQGGTALTSCMNVIGCHITLLNNNAPHPSKPWRGTTAAGSTGHSSADTSNDSICAICHTGGNNSTRVPQANDIHGSTGCFNATLCHGVTGHADTSVYPAPWSAAANHGAFARSDPAVGGPKGLNYCQHCHGTDFSGGSANQSCFPCHTVSAPHPKRADWSLKAGTLSHVNAGEGNAVVCATCHKASIKNLSEPYLTRFSSSPAGSFNTLATPGCYNASMCHGDVRKTSDCDACHSTATTNPFKSMAGATATSDPKVGAHVKHLSASVQVPVYSANIACSECHTVPSSPVISGIHRNGANDVVFGTLAKTGLLTPVYTAATGVCANTYCHGNTLDKPVSAILSPSWAAPFLSGNAASDCIKCHGYPPATTTHASVTTPTACIGCHPHVNASGTGFTDPTLHINGTINASGGAAPHSIPLPVGGFPGSSHKTFSNGTGCTGCHQLGTSASTYPAVSGTAPDCRACHLNANPTTDPHCSDCHGASATDGRPSGTSFPNRQGSGDGHNRGTHRLACTFCHPITTGSASHGWSNRTKSSNAQVLTTLNWNPGSRASGTGTCNPSAGGITGCHNSQTGWY